MNGQNEALRRNRVRCDTIIGIIGTLAKGDREKQLKKYGYFTTLTVAGDYLFRGYKREGEQGYGLQIYKNKDLVGDIHTKEAVNILGYQDGFYYGELPVDVDNEQFRIIRFKL